MIISNDSISFDNNNNNNNNKMSQTIVILSPEEYLERFPIKAEEVPRVIGKPTFVASSVVVNKIPVMAPILAPCTGAYLPQKLDLLPRLESERNSVQKHVPSY
jgi:hypothetical protein